MQSNRATLIPIYDSHNLYDYGGNKLHIYNGEKCLCGYIPFLFMIADTSYFKSLKEYLEQPDPSRNICLKCKKAAIKLIDNAKDNDVQ